MRRLTLFALAAALVAVGLVVPTGGARGVQTSALSPFNLTLSVDVVQTTLAGQVTARSVVSSPTNIAQAGSVTISSPLGPATMPGASAPTIQHAAGGGCASISPRIVAKHPVLQYPYWNYNAPAHWCWPCAGCNLNWYPLHAYFSSVAFGWGDANPNFVANGYFYPWRGNCCSGHYSLRQGKITEFVPGVNVPIGEIYPRVELWVTGPYWTAKATRGY